MNPHRNLKPHRNWLLAALGCALALLFAASAAPAQELKIGIVDVERALFGTTEGKDARKEFERKQREAQAEVQPLMNRAQELQEELNSKKFVLSEDAMFQKRAEQAELQNKMSSKAQELKGQLEIDRGRLITPLQQKLQKVIEDIGRDEGYTLILQRGNPLYAREALDITDLVIARFDKN